MRHYGIAILLSICVIGIANSDSFLTAESFPETFNDLSFTDRIAVLAEGYEPYEAEFKPGLNGTLVCVSGCPYQGMTIEDYEQLVERNTKKALKDTNKPSIVNPFFANNKCKVYVECPVARHPDIPVGQVSPNGEPLIGEPRITSSQGQRIHPITGKEHNHEAIDYAVPTGTCVYTTATGIVEKTWHDNRCGNGLKIKYANGMSAVFCHLEKSLVAKDENIAAGCAVALSGNTGNSTGPHLHYALKQNGEPVYTHQFTGRAK